VQRVDGADVDPALIAIRGSTEILRLIPNNAGAPVTWVLKKGDFAGVILRIGKSWTEAFPVAGV
jgi:hypothetical protein